MYNNFIKDPIGSFTVCVLDDFKLTRDTKYHDTCADQCRTVSSLCEKSGASNSSCSNNTAYTPGSKTLTRHESSAHVCRALCADSPLLHHLGRYSCKHFTWFAANKSCRITNHRSKPMRWLGATSGTSQCGCHDPVRPNALGHVEDFRFDMTLVPRTRAVHGAAAAATATQCDQLLSRRLLLVPANPFGGATSWTQISHRNMPNGAAKSAAATEDSHLNVPNACAGIVGAPP